MEHARRDLVLLDLVFVVISLVAFPGFLIALALTNRHEDPYAYPLIGTGLFWKWCASYLGPHWPQRWVLRVLEDGYTVLFNTQ